MRRQQRTPRPKTRLFQSLPFQGLIAAVPWNLVFTAIIGAVVMWMLLRWLTRSKAQRRYDSAPGPRGWPVLGNWPQLFQRKHRNNRLLQWAEQYGGIFRLSICGQPLLVVAEPDAAREVLIKQEALLIKPRAFCSSFSQMCHPACHPALLSRERCNDTWRVVRKCLAHSFSVAETREDFEAAKAKALLLVDVLSGLGPGSVVDVVDACTRLSLDVLGLAKFAYDFGAVETPEDVMVLRLLRECSHEFNLRQAFPLRPWFWWASDEVADGRQRYRIFQDFVATMWHQLKQQHGTTPAEDDTTLAAQLLRLRNPKTAKPVPADMMTAELAGILLAGHEALGHSLAWALYLLAANKDVQEKLYAELLREGFVNRPDTLTLQTVGSLAYLDGVVREVLRLYPTFGDGIMREATADLTIGSTMVPKGARVWVHPYALQRSSSVWKDSASFQPERWIPASNSGPGAAGTSASGAAGNNSKPSSSSSGYDGMCVAEDVGEAAVLLKPGSGKKGSKKMSASGAGGASTSQASEAQQSSGEQGGPQSCAHQAFMPFGLGQRSCLGQVFVQASLKAALGILAAFYKFELATEDLSAYAGSQAMTFAPPAGMPLIITLRNPGLFNS